MLTIYILICFLITFAGLDIEMSDCSDGDLQLIGGGNPREGRVEVCFSKVWGSICPISYGSEDAAVICHQLNETFQNFGPGIDINPDNICLLHPAYIFLCKCKHVNM